jgi:hypothetical protein
MESCQAKSGFSIYWLINSIMEGKITWKGEVKNYLLFTLKLANGDSAKTYVVKGFRNIAIWSHLKIGDQIEGLQWKDEQKKLIDADSPVHLA